MKVLVGITTRNRERILPRAIESALKQSYAPKEIAVVDDASDESLRSLAQSFPEVRWLFNATPQGYRNNRNRLMEETDAEFFVSLDDDAWFLGDDEIKVAVEAMVRQPKLAAIAFDILSPDRPQPHERTPARAAAMFIGCGHMLRLSMVREAGCYADLPGDYGSEERDLCLRLLDRGYEIALLPGVHVWHEKEWSQRDWFGTHASSVCNDLAMASIRCPFPDILGVLTIKLFNHLRFACRRPRFLKSTVAGAWRFCAGLPRHCSVRQVVSRATYWESIRRSRQG